MRRFLAFLFWMIVVLPLFGESRTVSGYVVDASTGETIIGVNVVVRGTLKGAATDGNGYFIISSLPPGHYTLDFTHIAYTPKAVPVNLSLASETLKEVALTADVVETQGVSIVGQKSELADLSLESGHREMTARAIRRIPASHGDVFRAVKYLPGVESVDPFSPLYAVRGGDTGENLILLDGVPIYNPYHFVGGSGLFNVYAIKDLELMVGGFGVEYGGRNSSVLYITTREGNNQALHGEISPGTNETQAVVDFPVGRRATMMVSGRVYYNLLSRFLLDAPSSFYDMNTTLTIKVGERHRLSLRGFISRDAVDFNSDTYFGYLAKTFDTDVFDDYDFGFNTLWNNWAVSAVLKSVISPKIYWQNQVYGSFFRSKNYSLYDWNYVAEDGTRLKLYMETDIRSAIQDVGWKSTLTLKTHDWNEIKTGSEIVRYAFENDILINGFSEGKVVRKPALTAGFLEDKLSLGPFSIRPGIRVSRFGSRDRWNREIRINGALGLTDKIILKSAWGQYLQPIISLNTQEYELSQYLDNYYPLIQSPPSRSVQAIFGLEWQVQPSLLFSLDLYHKDIQRTYTYDYNVSQMEAARLSDKIRAGSGEAYGAEILLKGDLGRISGWMSYGISRSTRRFAHIMEGKSFIFDYDRTHSFKTVVNYQVHPALEFSGTVRILSGVPKTLESGMDYYYYYSPVENQTARYPVTITPVKNNIRLPVFLKLDLGMKKRVRTGFGAELAKYLGADEAFLNITFGNLLFFMQRNVWFYINDEGKLYGVGTNYIPEFSAGYSIRF